MKKLTVILPAAGEGARLNLPYPKELLRLDNDLGLIDNSFKLFHNHSRSSVEFIVVINEKKTELITYLAKYKNKFDMYFIYQNPTEPEYTGAIKSAKPLFGEYNVVLLPDTIMRLPKEWDLHTLIMNFLDEQSFLFLYKKENDREILKTKGALFVEDHKVLRYEDKPVENIGDFNAFWCAFGFRKNAFDQCMRFMEQSTLKNKNSTTEIQKTPIYGSRGFEVEYYVDLGTWPEIRRLLRDHESDNVIG